MTYCKVVLQLVDHAMTAVEPERIIIFFFHNKTPYGPTPTLTLCISYDHHGQTPGVKRN